ncbi:MAG: hypothetical protein KC933_30630 [Myxococcales bacterium]|nr:hypothetical protein [Myxococcales bacterium]
MALLSRTLTLRWSGQSGRLRPIAEQIHEQIRAGVLAQVEAGARVDFVSCGVATPPGPTRLILEDRRRGLPGRAFTATLARDGDALILTVESGRLRPIPDAFLATLRDAVIAAVGQTAVSAWAAQ